MGNSRDRFLTLTAIFAVILLLITLASRSSSAKSWDYRSVYTKPIVPSPQAPVQQSQELANSPYGADQTQQYIPKHDYFLQERVTRAEMLWRQSVQDRKTMLASYSETPVFPDGYILPFNVWDFVRPAWFCPHDLERVGRLGDGAKWVCGMSRYEKESPGPSSAENPAHKLIMYSFGVNDDSSFEAAFLQRTNAEIWGYDYSVDSWANDISYSQLPRAHFKKAGIGKTNTAHNPPFYSIQDIMQQNGHDWVDIVKMDIEGAEYDALASLVDFLDYNGNKTLPFGQLLIELHFFDNSPVPSPKDLNEFLTWWEKLERLGLRPVNNEDNWIGDAWACRPKFMEYTMINALNNQRNVLLWA